MDWYIFLTPLLLLPILFLFRLVGCSYPDFQYRDDGDGGDGGPSEINITFKLIIADPIPPLVHNPDLIKYIWPMFTIDTPEPIGYAGGSPQQMFPQTNPPGEFDKPFTITSDKVPVPAGEHNCSCDVYITRLNIDEDPDKPLWSPEQHLIGPEPALQTGFGEISDNVITFILNYNPATSPPTDYPASDFELTPIT
jgi:hypothetical protein